MSRDLNITLINGRLTKDPVIAYIPVSGDAVCNFSIATNQSYLKDNIKTERVTFHNCVIYRKPAETFVQHLRKGSHVHISGEYVNDSYKHKHGHQVNTMKLIVNEFSFLDKKSDSDNSYNKSVDKIVKPETVAAPVDEPFDPDSVPF